MAKQKSNWGSKHKSSKSDYFGGSSKKKSGFGGNGFGSSGFGKKPSKKAEARSSNSWGKSGRGWFQRLLRPSRDRGLSLKKYYNMVDNLADHKISEGVDESLSEIFGRGGEMPEEVKAMMAALKKKDYREFYSLVDSLSEVRFTNRIKGFLSERTNENFLGVDMLAGLSTEDLEDVLTESESMAGNRMQLDEFPETTEDLVDSIKKGDYKGFFTQVDNLAQKRISKRINQIMKNKFGRTGEFIEGLDETITSIKDGDIEEFFKQVPRLSKNDLLRKGLVEWRNNNVVVKNMTNILGLLQSTKVGRIISGLFGKSKF